MNVTIRPLQESDAYTSVKWRNDPEVFKYTGNTYSREITIDNELEWIRKVISNPDDYRCAILADGVYVGNIYLTGINGGEADYHIFIGDRSYWGKGISKLASEEIIKYGFTQIHLNCIKLRVRVANKRAYYLYQTLGFIEVDSDETWILMKLLNKID